MMCLRFMHKNYLVMFSERSWFKWQLRQGLGTFVVTVTIINTWLMLGDNRGHAKKTHTQCWLSVGYREQTVSGVKVQCFVDPCIHPDLLPAWTLSLYDNVNVDTPINNYYGHYRDLSLTLYIIVKGCVLWPLAHHFHSSFRDCKKRTVKRVMTNTGTTSRYRGSSS